MGSAEDSGLLRDLLDDSGSGIEYVLNLDNHPGGVDRLQNECRIQAQHPLTPPKKELQSLGHRDLQRPYPLLFFLVESGVSKNNGTSKSSIWIGFFIINHPFWGTPIFRNTQSGDLLSQDASIQRSPSFFPDVVQLASLPKHLRLVVNQIIEEDSGEAYWKARVDSQGKVGNPGLHRIQPWTIPMPKGRTWGMIGQQRWSLSKALEKRPSRLLVGEGWSWISIHHCGATPKRWLSKGPW